MSPDSQSIESTDGLLRIEFRWLEDRYVQHLSLRGRDVGLSLEGGSSDAWPPSPPIQQLSVESINEQPTALAVARPWYPPG